jgi:hypothetical protein
MNERGRSRTNEQPVRHAASMRRYVLVAPHLRQDPWAPCLCTVNPRLTRLADNGRFDRALICFAGHASNVGDDPFVGALRANNCGGEFATKWKSLRPGSRAIGERLPAIAGRLQNIVTNIGEQLPHLAAWHFQFHHKGGGEWIGAVVAAFRNFTVLRAIGYQRSLRRFGSRTFLKGSRRQASRTTSRNALARRSILSSNSSYDTASARTSRSRSLASAGMDN